MSTNGIHMTNGVNGYGTGFEPPAHRPLADEDLLEWVRSTIESGPVDAILISHTHPGGLTPVNRVPTGPIDPDDLAARITRMATNHAKGFVGVQRYQIEALVHDNTNITGYRTIGSWSAVVQPQNNRAGGESEPANELGITSQIMRHKEGEHVITDRMIVNTFDRMERELRLKSERIAQLEGREVLLSEKIAQYTIAAANEQGILRRAEIRGEAEKMAIQELVKLIPVGIQLMASKMTGSESVVYQRLQAFAGTITKEQYGKLGEILDIDQGIQLADMLGKTEDATKMRDIKEKMIAFQSQSAAEEAMAKEEKK